MPKLEDVTADLYNTIVTQTGLPLQIEIVAYVGALGVAQYWHEDFPPKNCASGPPCFCCPPPPPVNYPLHGNKWVHGSSAGFLVPWIVRDMDAALGDAFVLNVCNIHKAGGLLEGVPLLDASQNRNCRCVGFLLLSTTPMPKNVTEGITPPFWCSDESMTLQAAEVALCGV